MIKVCVRYRISLLFATILALAAVGWGCGSYEEVQATDPHAGHDHGPGEHGIVARQAVEDPHAGHDHSPGEVRGEERGLDWCADHAVPESVCTRCRPELVEQFKADGDWCLPHDLPESQCRLCNPDIGFPQEEMLRERSVELAEGEIEVSLWHRPNAAVCATNGALIQFASEATAEKAGLTVQTAVSSEHEGTIEAPAEVVFDEAGCNVVTSTVPAVVSKWLVAPGYQVREGEVLAILNSPRIAELASQLLSAHAAHQVQQKELARHVELKAASLISDADYERQQALGEQAQAEYIAARGLLAAAGLSMDDTDEIIKHSRVSNSFALRAPTDGMMVDRMAQLGELIDAGGAFALLADPSSMWIEARLTEEHLRKVEVGQSLVFSSDGRGLDRVGARIIWVSRFLDQHSRTGTVRAAVVDPQHDLQAGQFGRAMIQQQGFESVMLVPKDAVQWEGCCNVVFVREAELRYRPRKVELLDRVGPFYQVTGDVRPGDEIVVDGAFLLKTELKKTSLGTGCCGLEPTG